MHWLAERAPAIARLMWLGYGYLPGLIFHAIRLLRSPGSKYPSPGCQITESLTAP